MGSATTQALAATAAALAATDGVNLGTAGDLFAAARAVGDSAQLSGALADPSASLAARAKVVADVFGGRLGAPAVSLLTTTVEQRWSDADDLVDGIEQIAVRAAAIAEPDADIEGELFQVTRMIAENPELELALGSRRGDAAKKGELITQLLGGNASSATTLIASSLVQQPRERRIRQVLNRAMRLVADERGRTVATVVAARPLSAEQSTRLAAILSAKYGRNVSLNTVVDPQVVGGIRVQIADDVIDASIASRLADLRQRLTG